MSLPGRSAGVLLHPTSLPGPGDLGPNAYRFVDFLAGTGLQLWQMLPVGPPGPGDSPYTARSAFAGDPRLIAFDGLYRRGLLRRSEAAERPAGSPWLNNFDERERVRTPVLRAAFARFAAGGGLDLLEAEEVSRPWLRPFAIYSALRSLSGQAWWEWTERFQHPGEAMPLRDTALQEEVHYHEFLQVMFDEQWHELRAYAHSRNVRLVGDVPIFVDRDSADHWAHQDLFKLDASGTPLVVAGVPPDGFSETGQRWGNPVYDWDAIKDSGYAWWVDRMQRTFGLFDVVRMDHFRGFAAAWEIPAAEPAAGSGHWVPGPGRALFDALEAALGKLPIVVEDLGVITDDVRELRESLGYPGMLVLQFAFGDDDHNPYLPWNHMPNSVVFTGTHDNNTTLGWWHDLPDWHRDRVRRALQVDGSHIVDDLARCAFSSVANTAIVPMQDILGLGGEHRMNYPGVPAGNWRWRFEWDQLLAGRVEWLAGLAHETGRVSAGGS